MDDHVDVVVGNGVDAALLLVSKNGSNDSEMYDDRNNGDYIAPELTVRNNAVNSASRMPTGYVTGVSSSIPRSTIFFSVSHHPS